MFTEELTTVKSINPATCEVLGEVPSLNAQEVQASVQAAWQAYESWRLTSYDVRARKLLKLRKLLVSQADEIATLVTKEVGKPLAESFTAELVGPLDACLWFAENTERLLKDQLINMTNPMLTSKQSIITFEPVGVVGMVAPWNYPFAIPMMSIIMAVMVGNTVVLKPSEKSSLTGIKIGELFGKAGFPPGVVSVITGHRQTGVYLTQQRLAKLIFTGSVAGGSKVMAQAADNLTPVTLELGGKDAAIVLPDAPPDWTARGLVWGAFSNCGQACASIERLYVVRGEHTQSLIERLVGYTQALKLGPGLDASSDVGPLVDEVQLGNVVAQVEEALSKGARVLAGGRRRHDLGGYFYEPTILVDVNHSMTIMREETFGPILPLMIVNSEDEAIELANDSDYGLSASVWSGNLGRAEDVARDLDVGTVFINDCLFSFACPQVPWGGLKKSGTGRTHSYFGLLDLVNIKHVSIDAAGGLHRQWWYPYGKSRIESIRGGLKLLHGNFPWEKLGGACAFLYNSVFTPK
ncbi:MAG: aldehyde dehydrogenase family protein [Candidatus Melainabacteria bacterium]|nr:aldehyde dehydrogenase family protein [Candidatus Melainabacteria bacterium]